MKKVVERSMLGKSWVIDEVNADSVEKIVKDFNLSKELAEIMVSRNIDDVENFINPSMHNQLKDPNVLQDMSRAVDAVYESIKSGDKIAVFGDYDVDGITSTAIMVKYFNQIGVNDKITWRLPSRESDGYGLNTNAIDEFEKFGTKLIITVDCGISAMEEAGYAAAKGIKLVITDHHNQCGDLPVAAAVVDPKRNDDVSGLSYLAGVGVAYLFLIALNRKLRDSGFFGEIAEPNMMDFLDLVMLGTICDTMPLCGLNRAIVSTGLKVANQKKNIGLRILSEIAGVKDITVYAAGFAIGPRLNASGRMGSADDSLKLLLTESEAEAREISMRLNELNNDRKNIESGILQIADEIIETHKDDYKNGIFICGKNWHGGVMGIIAGRLKEKYYRPALVATIKDDGTVNGSGRSVPEINLGKIIENAKNAGILIEGGGHAVAAGFSLREENIEIFRKFLNDAVEEQLSGREFSPTIHADIEMDAGSATLDMVRAFNVLNPVGQDNPEPTFILDNARVNWADAVGTGHLKIGVSTSFKTLSIIGFNMLSTPIGGFFMNETNRGRNVKLLGKLKENTFNGNTSVQLVLEDAAV